MNEKLTCKLIQPDDTNTYEGKQAFTYFASSSQFDSNSQFGIFSQSLNSPASKLSEKSKNRTQMKRMGQIYTDFTCFYPFLFV